MNTDCLLLFIFICRFISYGDNEIFTENENFIILEDVLSVLRKGGDSFNKSTIKGSLTSFHGGSKTFLGNGCAKVLAVFKYLCNNSSSYSF